MKLRPLTGTITALVTPFRNGQIAFDDLKKLVGYQIKGGINGLVPVGTTGESPTLSHEEHMEVIRFVIAEARGRVPVIAGTGSNSTHEAVELTKLSHDAGADATDARRPLTYSWRVAVRPGAEATQMFLAADETRHPVRVRPPLKTGVCPVIAW